MEIKEYLFKLKENEAEENIQDLIGRQKARDVSINISKFLEERF